MKAINELLVNVDERSYYSEDGKKIYLNPIPDSLLLQLDVSHLNNQGIVPFQDYSALSSYIEQKQLLIGERLPPFLEIRIGDSESRDALLNDLNSLVDGGPVLNISQMYSDDSSKTVYALLNQLVVKFKNEVSDDYFSLIRNQLKLSDISAIASQQNTYMLTLSKESDMDALDASNYLFESGECVYAQPNFFRSIPYSAFTPNDPYFSAAWHLPKIQAPDAWCWANGTGINIGIMDVAVQTDHIDLSTLPGYDPTGMPLGTDRHGTVCAGAAAAIGNNGTLVTGSAFQANIIQLRIGYNPTSDPTYGFFDSTDAWQYGALEQAVYNLPVHVLSCSFGLGNPSSLVMSGFQLAYQNGGRSGRGIPIFAATGNGGTNNISYPASSPYTMAVGSTGTADTRTPSSNYGAELGIVAPGQNIYTTAYQNTYIVTGGTSLATPITAGIAAMILQFQPNYTPTQVYQVLGNTADKVGGYSYGNYGSTYPFGTWNNEMGYGRLNAYKAIQQALPYAISGAAIVCTNGSFQINNLPSGSNITWSTSVHFTISGSNTANPVSIQSATVGWGTVTATVNSSCGSPFVKTLTVPSGAAPVPGEMQVVGPFNLLTDERGLFSFPTSYPGVPPSGYVFLVNGQQSGLDFQIDFFSFGESEITFYNTGSYAVSVRVETPCGNVVSFPFYVNVS